MARIFVSTAFLMIFFTVFMTSVPKAGSFGFGADWSWDWLWKNIGKLGRFNVGASKGAQSGHRSGYKGGGQRISLGSDWWQKFSETWEKNSKEDDSSEENVWEAVSGNTYLTGEDKKLYNINNEVDIKQPGVGHGGAAIGGESNNVNGEDAVGTDTSGGAVGDGSSNGDGNGGTNTSHTSNGETVNGDADAAASSTSTNHFGTEEPENETEKQTSTVQEEQEMEGQQGGVARHSTTKPDPSEEPEAEENITYQNGASVKNGGVGNNSETAEEMEAEDMKTTKSTSSTAMATEENEFEAEDTTVQNTVSSSTRKGENEAEAEMEGNGQNPNNQESESSTVKSVSKGPQQGQSSKGTDQGQTSTGLKQGKTSGGPRGLKTSKGENETEAEMEGNGQNPSESSTVKSISKGPQQGQSSIAPQQSQTSTGSKQSQISDTSSAGGTGEKESQPIAQKLHKSLAKLNPAVGNVPKIHIQPKVAAAEVTPGVENDAEESNDASVNNLSVNNWEKSASSKNNKISSTNTVTQGKSNGNQGQSSLNNTPVSFHIDKMKSLLIQQKPATIIKEFIDLSGATRNRVSVDERNAAGKHISNNQQTQHTENNRLKGSLKPVVSGSKTSDNIIHKESSVLSLGNKDLIELMTKMANKIKQSLMVPKTHAQNKIAGTPNKDIVADMSSASILEGKGSNIDVVPTDGSISAGAKTDLLSRDQTLNEEINSVNALKIINTSEKDKVQGDLSQNFQTTEGKSALNMGSQTKSTNKDGNIAKKGVQHTQTENNFVSPNNKIIVHSAKKSISNNVEQSLHAGNNVQTGSVSKTANTKPVTPGTTTPEQTTKWVAINKSGFGGGLGTGWRGSRGWRGGSGTQGRGDSNWLTGSANDAWISGAKADARELATEMEGQWQSVNVSKIGQENATCPIFKVSYQKNAVVIETVQNKCRIIITWHPRVKREEFKEQTWWGEKTYHRTRTHYVPVVTYVDIS